MRRLSRWLIPLALLAALAAALYSSATSGRRALARERALCRAAGIPLPMAAWKVRAVPAAQNAAPDYEKLGHLLAGRDFTNAEEELLSRLSPDSSEPPLSAAEMARVRRALASRQNILTAIHRAAAKPSCAIPYKPVDPRLTRMYDVMRMSVGCITWDGLFLARQGRYAEAARTAALGFRIGRHAGQMPGLLANLIGDAIDHRVQAHLAQILQIGGPDAAAPVQAAITDAPPPASLAPFFAEDVGENEDWFRQIRTTGYTDFAKMSLEDDTLAGGRPTATISPIGAFIFQHVPPTYHDQIDRIEADYLRTARTLISLGDRPFPERRREVHRLNAALDPADLDHAYSRLMLRNFNSASRRAATTLALRRAVLAGAEVLAYRGRTGHLPERLEEAMARLPIDPFTERPLSYRREGADRFVVFSANADGKDVGAPRTREEWRTDRYQNVAFFRYPRTYLSSAGHKL